MEEVRRLKDFHSGDVECVKCKREITLFWNGGELDRTDCCGYSYRTEHQGVDLVIYKDQ